MDDAQAGGPAGPGTCVQADGRSEVEDSTSDAGGIDGSDKPTKTKKNRTRGRGKNVSLSPRYIIDDTDNGALSHTDDSVLQDGSEGA